MSDLGSVFGINVRELMDENKRLEAENDKLYKAFSFSQDLNRNKGVELAAAICRIQQLEEALRFYADPANNLPTPDSAGQLVSNVALDNGEIARAALSLSEAPEKEED